MPDLKIQVTGYRRNLGEQYEFFDDKIKRNAYERGAREVTDLSGVSPDTLDKR